MIVPNGTRIYLAFGRRIRIPVNPEEISITYPSNNETYHVLGVGEIVVPRSPGLTEVSWQSFLPGDDGDPYTTSGASPDSVVKALTRAKKRKRSGRLIITRAGLLNTNLRCIIEDFETTDKGGEPGDLYYSIRLKEYRAHSAQTVTIVQPPPPAAAAPDQPAEAAQATAETERPVETPTLRVGAQVVANGNYWYDSYGSNPHGTANNLSTTVTRIVDTSPYPVHIGHYGWLTADQLQIVG